MKTSRSDTASIEFCVSRGRPRASTNPSSRAVNSRSMGSVVPAIAMVASLLVLRRYDLTAERLAQVVEEAGTGTGIEPVNDPHV